VKEYNLEDGDFSLWGELEAGEDGEEFVQDWNSTLVKTLRAHSATSRFICLGSFCFETDGH